VLYGNSIQGLVVGRPIIYRGTFGTALFQCIYQPGPAHWAMLPSTFEWHVGVALFALAGMFWPSALLAAGALLSLSWAVAALQARQAVLAPKHKGLGPRLLVMALCYAQPLIRSWHRYRTRLFAGFSPSTPAAAGGGSRFPLLGRQHRAYWSEDGYERTELLGLFLAHLIEHRWGTATDSGWSDWDVEIHPHPWTRLQVCTAQENHGGPRHLIRLRYRLRETPFARTVAFLGLAACGLLASFDVFAASAALGVLALLLSMAWLRGLRLAARAVDAFEGVARGLGLISCRS
jgi:hypothetical protein